MNQMVANCGAGSTSRSAVEPARTVRRFIPNVDILETGDEIIVQAEIPGVSPDGIDVSYEQGVLTIRGSAPERPRSGRQLMCEYAVGDFHRQFRIGEGLDSNAIQAEYALGVLTLRLPKTASTRSRRIPIQAGA